MDLKSLAFICVFLLFQSLGADALDKNQFPPKADAHFDQFANINETVKLNASNSTDKDGDPLSYQWIIIERPEGSLAKVQDDDNVTTFLSLDKAGTYTIELLVSDGLHVTSSDTLLIDTEQTKPQLSKIEDQKVLVGEIAELEIQDAFDPDGDDILMFWDLEKSPMGSSAQIQNPTSESATIITDRPGKYSIRLQVSDNKHIIKSNLFKVHAVEFFDRSNRALGCVLDRIFFDGFEGLFTNTAPVADVGPDTTGVIGQAIELDGSLSSDIDLDTLTYSWSLLTAPNGSTAVIDNDDQMQAGLTPDLVGDYVAQLIVNDGCLDSDPDSALVTISVNQPPTITSSPDTTVRESQAYSYQVVATDPENHSLDYDLSISPAGASIDSNGLMTWQSLGEGTYPVTVVVTDEYNSTDSQSYDIDVTVNNAPQIQSFPISSAEKDLDYSYQVVVSDADSDPITFQLINPESGMSIDNNGLITWTPNAAGNFSVEVNVDDGFGGTDTQLFTIEVIELPPDPNDIAPALSKTSFVPFIETVNFLYESVPPVQIGMTVDTIQDYRAAIVKGRVLDADGNPLQGVKVSINNHPEYGYTYSRGSGEYDLVVNGGGTLTVNFTKGGFITSQRDIQTPWEDFVYSEDIVLVRLDNQVTRLDLTDTTNDYQVVRGSEVTDSDGSRQATMLFPSGIQASLEFEDGTTQSISNISVRATEFTVGSYGMQRMPSHLPPASGYTYAVELSLDEAINQEAIRVNFDQNIQLYLENFIGFPTGTKAPLASYDRQIAYWIPELAGLVISINRIENGAAVLDVTNDDVVNDATQAELDELGITNAELTQLAQMYEAGQSLWRTSVNHFTPWDINWPYIPPPSLQEPPEQPQPEDNPEIVEDDSPEDEPEDLELNTDCTGCIINAQNRTLEEEIPLVGTDHSLYYSSNSVFPSSGFDEFVIPLIGDTVPAELLRVELVIDGEVLEFEPSENLSYTYVWDGTDHYDRSYHSKTTSYNVHYYFPLLYSPGISQAEFDRSFGVYEELNLNPLYTRVRSEIELRVSRYNKIKLYRKYNTFANSNVNRAGNSADRKAVREEQLNLGGWAIKDHHVYNTYQRVLLKGDGFKRKVQAFRAQVDNPNVSNHPGPTDISQIDETWAVEVAPNDEIYFADRNKGHIVKIDVDGNAVRVAGRIHEFFPSCNETPIEQESALDVCLTGVQDIKIAPNGDIYYVYDRRVRKIDRDGIVTTVAGNGSYGSSPDGTPATSAEVEARYIAFDKHGTLFISVGWGIRKVDSDGNIQTVAGGSEFFPGDEAVFENVLATETAMFNASGIVISDAGSIFVADTGHECVRQITPDGWIYTVNGSTDCFYEELNRGDGGGGHIPESAPRAVDIDSNGAIYILDSMYDWQGDQNKIVRVHPYGQFEVLLDSLHGFSGDGGLLNNAQLNTSLNFSLNQFDEILIADSKNDRIRKVDKYNIIDTIAGGSQTLTPPAPIESYLTQKEKNIAGGGSILLPDSLVVVSLDGKLIYEFSDEGAHQRTIDSTTGRVYKEFNYDASGRLTSIRDSNGLLTQLERTSGTNVNAIVSSYGKRTELEYYPNGQLQKVTDPEQNHWDLGYSTNNQLNLFIDRNENRFDYTYSSFGLLESDANPIGGGWLISTDGDTEGVNQVVMTSGEGREYVFLKDSYPYLGQNVLLENTKPDGTVISHVEKIHDSIKDVTTYPDGTIVRNGDSKGSRFGFQYHWDNDIEVITPSGLRKHTWNVFANDYDGNPPAVITPVPEYSRTSIVENQPWVAEYKQSFGSDGGFRNITPELRTNLTLLNNNKKVISYALNGFNDYNIEYDGFGRVQRMYTGTGQELRETVFSYYDSGPMNGEVHTITNPLGHVSTFEYDNNGRVTKKIFPDSREAIFSYDANGNLSSLTPPGRPTHNFGYNGVDQLNNYSAPLVAGVISATTGKEYNTDQQLTKITTPDGREVNITYNSVTGKMETKTLSVGTYVYGYDPVSGKLSSITSPDGVDIAYEYDGFLPTSTTWSGTINGKVSRTYDNLFRVTGRMINDADEILYQYDNDNLLTNAGSMSINRETQKGGMVNGTTLNNVVTSNTYTDFAELDLFDVQYNSTSIFNIDYTMDKLGRVDTSVETIDSLITSYDYDYDLSGRLNEVKINGAVNKSWQYDSNGNRTHEDGVLIATYDDQDRLLTYKQYTYTYNNNGELETKIDNADVTSYSFDEEGLLRSVTLPDSTEVQYLLDGLGRRVGKSLNGNLIKGWLYLDGLKPVAELDNVGSVVSRFIYATKTNVPSYMINNGSTYRIISDHLGSPRMVIDVDTGVVAQEITYDVWGNIISDSNPGFQPFGFAGGLYDSDTGLTRFGMREYDPYVGRWLSKDPLLFNGKDSNLYTYVFNDPVNFRDDDGEIANWVVGGLVIGLTQAIATYNATDDFGSAVSGFVAGFISGALPVLKLSRANPGKALGEITAEISDVLGGIALDVGLTLIFDTNVFVPTAEAATLEEHTIEGDHEHGLMIYICSGSGDCPPAKENVCIPN
ncbi:PKD domain-containing protein [Marinicella meishanensis]|uniref:PKD domain-containing protein n=1 Tax=Marinicella meishanensis TaxID=2873263 RepID=UPI001CC0942C|nr:RHS repeat-associated core domain-containing protein [Marinicella sp. NBU2979]